MKTRRIVVLGGGYGGLAVASRLAAEGGFDLTVVDAKDHFFERIRLHEVAAGRDFKTWSYAEILAQAGAKSVGGTVEALDPDRLSVTVRTNERGQVLLAADVLVYALGSIADDQSLPGLSEHGFTLSSPAAAKRINDLLSSRPTSSVVIGGGGLTALELAAELAEARPSSRIALVAGNGLVPGSGPGGFRPKAMEHIRACLARLNVSIRDGKRVRSVARDHVVLDDGARVPCHVYVHACGFAVSDLAARSRLQTDASGRIIVDSHLRSVSHPSVIAIGDAAAARTREGNVSRLSCATALPMGVAAGRNIIAMSKGDPPREHVPGYSVRNVSLGRHDGVIQFIDDEDRPLREVWTGAKAARWKEYICQTTLRTIRVADEPRMPSLPPVTRMLHLVKHAKAVA